MGGSFYVLYEINICKKIIRQKRIAWLTDPKKLPGKISVRLIRTARPGLSVSGKIILASNPSDSPEMVMGFYSNTYPELTTATVHGPTMKDDAAVYEFKTTIGTKG